MPTLLTAKIKTAALCAAIFPLVPVIYTACFVQNLCLPAGEKMPLEGPTESTAATIAVVSLCCMAVLPLFFGWPGALAVVATLAVFGAIHGFSTCNV